MRDEKVVELGLIPLCEFCIEKGRKIEASVDGKTCFGGWAFMCNMCHKQYGKGFGLGRGQKIVRVKNG